MVYYVIGILVAFASSAGQVCFKLASRCTFPPEFFGKLRCLFSNGWFFAGVLLFVGSVISSIWVMRQMEFSAFYALSALNYVFITFLSARVLKEQVDRRKMLGNAIIIAGILIYSFGST